jgi:hypothetical protein
MNIKPLYKRDLGPKHVPPPLRENVATIELFWAEITDHLADMALTASPVENSHIAKGTVEMFSGESLYKPSQVAIRILARRLREETVGRQCRRRFANLLIEWPMFGEYLVRDTRTESFASDTRPLSALSLDPDFRRLACSILN